MTAVFDVRSIEFV
jgi:hypothetical protein